MYKSASRIKKKIWWYLQSTIDPQWEVGGKENVYHFLRSGPDTQSPDMGQEMHWWLFDLPNYMPIAA